MSASHRPGSLGRFLTLADVCEILNIGMDAAVGLVRSGELPAIRIGGRGEWRVERDLLEAFIADQYEAQRRIASFHEAAFVDLPELSGGRIRRD